MWLRLIFTATQVFRPRPGCAATNSGPFKKTDSRPIELHIPFEVRSTQCCAASDRCILEYILEYIQGDVCKQKPPHRMKEHQIDVQNPCVTHELPASGSLCQCWLSMTLTLSAFCRQIAGLSAETHISLLRTLAAAYQPEQEQLYFIKVLRQWASLGCTKLPA